MSAIFIIYLNLSFLYFFSTYFNPLTSHLPSLSSLFLSLYLSLSGCTWYSLACLSSRRLDSSNLLQQPRASSNDPFNKAWASSIKISSSTSLSRFFFSHRSLSFHFVWPHPLLLCARLTGADIQGRLRQPPPPWSAGWVFFFPSLLPRISYYHPNLLFLLLFISLAVRSHSVCLTNDFSLHKVKAKWLTGAVSKGWQSWCVWSRDIS